MQNHYSVIIVGGGQAGLSMSYCLKERGIDHIVFEKNRIGHSWRDRRWDSFCLVTPNWQCQLPGYPYNGNDPHGFMQKDDIVKYIEEYAASVILIMENEVFETLIQRGFNNCLQICKSLKASGFVP